MMEALANNTTFVGEILGGVLYNGKYTHREKKAIEQSSAQIASYRAGLNKAGDHPSSKEEPWIPAEIQDEIDKDYKSARDRKLRVRALDGFYCACHVFAFLSKKEETYGDNWLKENRKCANMICNSILKISGIYKSADLGNDIEDVSEYGMNVEDKYKPIVLKETIEEAFKRYPVEGIMPILDSFAAFNDDDVEVMDVEDVVKKMSAEEKKDDGVEALDVIEKFLAYLNKMVQFAKEKKEEEKTATLHPMDSDEDEDPNDPDVKANHTDDGMKKDDKKSESQQKPADDKNKEPKTEKPEGYQEDKKPERQQAEQKPAEEPKTEEPKTKKEDAILQFDPEKMVIVPDEDQAKMLPPLQAQKFERIFGKFLEGMKWELHKFPTGLIECAITTPNGGVITHMVDPGLVIGDGWYIISNMVNTAGQVSMIFVHQDEEAILEKVFKTVDKQYILTPEEIKTAMDHLFYDDNIYAVIDMSNMEKHLQKIKGQNRGKDQFIKLGKKLSFIINKLMSTPNMGRLRFSKFSDIDHFELKSDSDKRNKLKSPMPGITLENQSGVTVQVDRGDVLIISADGHSQKFKFGNN